jgi:hypothetical protein
MGVPSQEGAINKKPLRQDECHRQPNKDLDQPGAPQLHGLGPK